MKLPLLALAALGAGAALAAGAPSSVDAGERAFQKCYACHSVRPGETGLSGPNLRGVVGRRVASERGFDYSPALLALAQREPRWNAALLDRYITDPEMVAPGTSMTFTGIRDEKERAALIAYLRR
jgi:cytochrome c